MRIRKQVLVAVGLLAGGGAAIAASPGHRPRAEGRLPRLAEELGLSSEQRDQIEKMRLETERQTIRRRADLAIARLDLRSLVEAKSVDEKAVAAKVKDMSDLQAGMLRARVDHVLAFRRVLTPEQQEKLRSVRPPMGHGRPEHRRGMRGGEGGPIAEEGEGQDEDEIAALTAF